MVNRIKAMITVAAISALIILLVVFHIPLVQPEFTIQCVSEPCIIDNITIAERYLIGER